MMKLVALILLLLSVNTFAEPRYKIDLMIYYNEAEANKRELIAEPLITERKPEGFETPLDCEKFKQSREYKIILYKRYFEDQTNIKLVDPKCRLKRPTESYVKS